MENSDKLLPRLTQMLYGWRKHDPPTIKKFPVEADVPELLSAVGAWPTANQLDRAIGDRAHIAFYYLLRVGKYIIKSTQNHTKQTVQFRISDVTFFKHDAHSQLRQLSRHASSTDIMSATSATLKLDNQKNGWKGMCIHQETNGKPTHCPIHALGRQIAHIRSHTPDHLTFLSAFFEHNKCFDVTGTNMGKAIKTATALLNYPTHKGIPVNCIDMHSMQSGGANVLSLSGYSDREIQKLGWWQSATFKEYI